MRKNNINSIFYIQIFTKFYILGSIIVLFFLSYNNSKIIYKPIIFIVCSFFIFSIFTLFRAPKLNLFLICIVFIFYLLILNLNSNKTFCSSYNPNKIVKIQGYVIKDVTKTQSGNYYFRINSLCGFLSDGTRVSVKGQVSILSKENHNLLYLTPVVLDVEYVEDIQLYKAKEIKVISKNCKLSARMKKFIFLIRDSREYLIKKIKAYLKFPLSRMLILGRSDQDGFIFKNYALSLGCAHLLALSGMHLSIISLLFISLFSKIITKKKSKYLTLLILTFYIYITGLIPSLIRSYIMYVLSLFKFKSDLHNEIILLFSAMIQAIIFPSTFISAGCLFSYGALAAIFIYSTLFHPKFKISNMVLTTVFAILITYPLSLPLGGSWCVLSIILSPLLTLFITLEMILSLIVVINSIFVDFCLNFIFRFKIVIIDVVLKFFLEIIKEMNYYFQSVILYNEKIIIRIFKLFEYYSKLLPDYLISYKGYLIFAFIVLTTSAVYLYSKGINKIGVSHNELGLPI